MSPFQLTAIILSLFGTLFVVIKLIRHPHWAIRFFDFPQVQVLALAAVILVVDLVVFDFTEWYEWIISGLLGASIVYQITIILPYTILYPKQSRSVTKKAGQEHISILVSNVYMKNRAYQRLIQLVESKDPDILITLETDSKWEKALVKIETDYPYTAKIPQDNMYGMHVYSKWPLGNLRIRYLIEEKVPSVTAEVRMPSGRTFILYAVHPKPPSPTENEESLERDGELYLVGREISGIDRPVIIAGDLNDVAWSHSTRLFQKISKLLDPRIGRGFFNTFHSGSRILRWPLDHIFHSNHFGVSRIERLPHIGSDHFPFFIDLAIAENSDPAWLPADPDDEEKKSADETIRKARLKNS
jgi:endonuclease/exonuclease/phosphatase (EEP) superfamily protein YafD